MEGEDGNDQFVIRAFVVVPVDAALQETSEVDGGIGADVIQYAINAPVKIDGGDGIDTVVVLGTPFPDAFVVTRDGIFGAGLNVRFDNIEKAEVDGMEGDDQIFVLSTRAGVVTTIIGGLGNDVMNVLGDVTTDIISNDLLGSSGLINQSISSTGAVYSTVAAEGVAVSVLNPVSGAMVNLV